MRTLLSLSRYLVLVTVVGLLVASLAVFVSGGITTLTTVASAFGNGEFSTEGSRLVSIELIEVIDLFLLGTVLLIAGSIVTDPNTAYSIEKETQSCQVEEQTSARKSARSSAEAAAPLSTR